MEENNNIGDRKYSQQVPSLVSSCHGTVHHQSLVEINHSLIKTRDNYVMPTDRHLYIALSNFKYKTEIKITVPKTL